MNIIKDRDAAKLLENISIAMLSSLNTSFAALKLITDTLVHDAKGAACDEPEGKYQTAVRLPEDEQARLINYLAMLRHTQHNLLYIAQNLSEIGTSAADETPYSFRTLNLDFLCSRLSDTVAKLTASTGVQFSYVKKADMAIQADYVKLERMLLSLISNSFLHCGRGDSIFLTIDKNDEFVRISVADNGTGISRQTMPILFEDYLRDIMDFKPNNGVGLGMSVAENIARMHGGSLMISSSPDKGTTVTVSLPACGAELLGSEGALDYGDTNMANVLTALSPVLDYKKYAYFYE